MKLPKDIEALLKRDAGSAPSKLPSDNVSTLDLDADAWSWVNAIYLADQKRDPAKLIALLAQALAPPAVQPYLTALLQQRLGGKAGRLSYLPTQKTINYYIAEKQVRELVATGMLVGEAAKKVAPQWGLTPKALTEYCRGRSGYARARRP